MHNPLFITPSTFLSPPTRTKSGCIGLHSTESKRMLDEDIVIVRQTPKLENKMLIKFSEENNI